MLLFDILTLFTFPFLGRLLNLSAIEFGVWAGVSMYSTGPVAAAGFAFSDVAGRWATITKLTRNTFIGIAVLLYSLAYTSTGQTESHLSQLGVVWKSFPKFVFGFIGVVFLSNSGILTTNQVLALEHSYRWLFLFAFAGLGMNLNLTRMRETGLKPVGLVFLGLIGTSVFALGIIRMFL